jgi:hypothetical protein
MNVIFTDESGVVDLAPNQPQFGIGMLQIPAKDVGDCNHELNRILDKYVTRANRTTNPPRNSAKKINFEFKFSRVTKGYVDLYREFVDYFFNSSLRFCAFVVDKQKDGVRITAPSWDALGIYSSTVIGHYTGAVDTFVLSDFYQRPRNSPRAFEDRLLKLRDVRGALMIDSKGCPPIQLVDVLLGSVMYLYKLRSEVVQVGTGSAKYELAQHVAMRAGLPSPIGKWTTYPGRKSHFYFSVWEFQPKTSK